MIPKTKTAARVRAPKPSRPKMAKGYGVPKDSRGLLPWSHVDKRLAAARNYWVATTLPDGRPHVMPVWGVWIEGVLYFGTDRNSRKSRNLAMNPAVAVHLESGDDVVIVEGIAKEASKLTAEIDDAYLAKYGMRLRDAPGDLVVYAVSPRTVFAWQESTFPKSVTRWVI